MSAAAAAVLDAEGRSAARCDLAGTLQAAVSHHRHGRLAEAVALYRGLLRKHPRNFEALYNIGLAYLQQGEFRAARQAIRKALDERPGSAAAHHSLGIALVSSKRLSEAVEQFDKALISQPQHAEARASLGVTLLALDRAGEAICHFEQVLLAAPDNAVAHSGLGFALKALGRHDEAIVHFRRALTINPGWEALHNDLGISLQATNRPEEALASYEQAIAVQPGLADAHHNKGTLLDELGRFAEARRAFETAIALAPTRPQHYRGFAAHHRFAAGDPRLAAMQALARDAGALPPDDRIELSFALAKAFADLQQYDEAFRHLLAGNTLKRTRIDYDEPGTLAAFGRIRDVFTPELLPRRRGSGDPTPAPVFILGMPRSGTTLVEQILASHPVVYGAGELPDLQGAIERATGEPATSPSFPAASAALAGRALARLGAEYGARVRALAPWATRIVDKMPANFRFIGIIHLALPNARIIHLCRGPIDTCFSCFSQLFSNGQAHTYDLAELGRYYRAYSGVMAHWRAVLPPGAMLDVQYEAVVTDLEREARRIVAHCGLDWDPACLRFDRTKRLVRTASAVQVRRPIYRSSIGRWRPYRRWLQPLFDGLGCAVPEAWTDGSSSRLPAAAGPIQASRKTA